MFYDIIDWIKINRNNNPKSLTAAHACLNQHLQDEGIYCIWREIRKLKNENFTFFSAISREVALPDAFFLLSIHESKIYPPEFLYAGVYPFPESFGSKDTVKNQSTWTLKILTTFFIKINLLFWSRPGSIMERCWIRISILPFTWMNFNQKKK